MQVIVLIGDLVASKESGDRAALQRKFEQVMQRLNATGTAVLSPYTITLGDEFQAVLSDGYAALDQSIRIRARMRPDAMRLSLAAGALSTPLKRDNAIGMDGPAFHLARRGIEQLKKSGGAYHIGGLPEALGELVNCSLRIAELGIDKWNENRWNIALGMREGRKVRQLSEQLGISESAVYKNIKESGLEDIDTLFRQIGQAMNRVVEQP